MDNTSTTFLREYLKALVKNVRPTTLPSTQAINVIFDGGALNGTFGLGITLYVKALEDAGYLQIKKVSGCSIGALLAIWFVFDCPENSLVAIQNLFESYKSRKNYSGYHEAVKAIVFNILPAENSALLEKLNGKLFVNFFNTTTGSQEVISQYSSRDHLISYIIRSGHIPYLVDGHARCETHYMDGIVPYIFPESEGVSLFIKLVSLRNIRYLIKVPRNEYNVYNRVFAGVVEANKFFVKGTGNGMCSYVHKWNLLTKLQIHSRPVLILTFLTFVELLLRMYALIPTLFTDSLLSLYFRGKFKDVFMTLFASIVEN
jgi:hypothetical protein